MKLYKYYHLISIFLIVSRVCVRFEQVEVEMIVDLG